MVVSPCFSKLLTTILLIPSYIYCPRRNWPGPPLIPRLQFINPTTQDPLDGDRIFALLIQTPHILPPNAREHQFLFTLLQDQLEKIFIGWYRYRCSGTRYKSF